MQDATRVIVVVDVLCTLVVATFRSICFVLFVFLVIVVPFALGFRLRLWFGFRLLL